MKTQGLKIKTIIILAIVEIITVNCVWCGMGAQCCYEQSPMNWERGYKAGSDCCAYNFANCAGCTNVYNCTSCISQEYCLSLGSCNPCDAHLSNCQTCSDCNTCITCNSNMYAVNSSLLCQLCSSLLLNCQTCTSATSCSTCISDSFTLNNSTLQCQQCDIALPYCQRCSAIDKCSTCINDSFILNNSTLQCQQCDITLPYCQRCLAIDKCTHCTINENITLSTSGSCQFCIDLIDRCISCSSHNTCTLCQKHFIVARVGIDVGCQLCANIMYACSECISDNICVRCGLGVIVQNGCSTTPGCIAVLKSNKNPKCVQCNPSQFHPSPSSSGICLCLNGHLAGSHCTSMPGCTNIIKNIDSQLCKACSSNDNFYLSNGRCYCKQNYELINDKCMDICGDGIVITLPCDDGNNIDGDGCSSQCQIQYGYGCYVEINKQPSRCVYEGGPVQLKLDCIYKYQELNTAKVILKLNPTIDNFFKYDSSAKIHYQSSSNSSISHVEFANPEIIIFIKFLQSIEGNQGQITLQYDKYFIKSPKSALSFKFTQCNGDHLDFLPQTQSNWKEQITFIVKIITIMVLVIWLLGSYSHKMIGIQTLHVFQIIIISQSFSQFYQPILSYFHDIHNVLGIYKDLVISSYSIVNRIEFIRLSYGADFVSNMAVIIGFNFLVLLVYFSLEIVNKYFKTKGKYAITLKKINNFRIKMYDYFLFPIYIGFSFSFLVSLTIYCHRNYIKFYSYYLQSCMAVFTVASTCYVYFDQWKYAFISQFNPKRPLSCKKSYVPIYLTYTCFMCFVIQFTLAKFVPYNIEIFACSQIIYTIFLLIYRPYTKKIHNIGLIIYQIGILSNLAWLLSQNYYPQFRRKQQLFAIILISQLCLIILYSFIRIIYELRQPKVDIRQHIIRKDFDIRDNIQQHNEGENEESISRSLELIQERQKYTIQFLKNDHFLNSRFKQAQKSMETSQLHLFVRNRLKLRQYINNQEIEHNDRLHQCNRSLNQVLIV